MLQARRQPQRDGPSDSRTPIGGVHPSGAPHGEDATQSDFRARTDASALCARTPLFPAIFPADAPRAPVSPLQRPGMSPDESGRIPGTLFFRPQRAVYI